jgi:hypothetical protein
MRKPTVAAWLVNQLARHRRDELAELLELGRDMREGMGGLDADGLRDLTRRRRRLVTGLVALAREVGEAAGQRIGDDAARAVQTTLEATLSDDEGAEAVRLGCLVEPLEVSGFGAAFGFGAAPPARPDLRAVEPHEGRASVTDIADRRARKEAEVTEAEQGLADAELLSRQAQDAYDRAHAHTAEQQSHVDEASGRIDRLQAELDEARADLAERTQAARAAKLAESDAEKALHAATRALAAATERLRRLRR